MADIALFHPSFGVSPGVTDAADRFRAAGHRVIVVDQYDGTVFRDYDEADQFVERIGFPELMHRALVGVEQLADGFVAAGFSNGGGMAEYVATQRSCAGVLMMSGALPVEMLGASGWPRETPAQVHYSVGDPRRNQEWLEMLLAEVRAASAPVELFEYAGNGHLFTDPSRVDEYDSHATGLLFQRALEFCARVG